MALIFFEKPPSSEGVKMQVVHAKINLDEEISCSTPSVSAVGTDSSLQEGAAVNRVH